MKLIPAITGQPPLDDKMRELFALPAWLGGLGITDPIKAAPRQQEASVAISGPLVEELLKQDHKQNMQDTRTAQQATKQQLHHQHQREVKMEATA